MNCLDDDPVSNVMCNSPIGHLTEEIPGHQIIQLFAGDCLGDGHCAAVHDWLGLGWWRRGTLLLWLLWCGWVEVFPEAEAHVPVLALHHPGVCLYKPAPVSPRPRPCLFLQLLLTDGDLAPVEGPVVVVLPPPGV